MLAPCAEPQTTFAGQRIPLYKSANRDPDKTLRY